MLFCGAVAPPNKPWKVDPKPKVILIDAITEELNTVDDEFPFSYDFRELATEALEESALIHTEIVGSHKKATHIPQSQKDVAHVQLQFDVDLVYDYSRVKKKKKTGYNPLGGGFTFKYSYSGEVDITPVVFIIVRDPKTQNLLQRIELELDEVTVNVKSTETSTYPMFEVVLLKEDIAGVTDILDSTVKKIGNELSEKLEAQFSNTQFLEQLKTK